MRLTWLALSLVLLSPSLFTTTADGQTPPATPVGSTPAADPGILYVRPVAQAGGSSGLREAYASIIPAARWQPNTEYAAGTVIYDGMSIQQVKTAGTSGATAPQWASGTKDTKDNTVTWTAHGVPPPAVIASGNPGTENHLITNIYNMSIRGVPEGTLTTDYRGGSERVFAYHPQMHLPAGPSQGIFSHGVTFTTAPQDMFPTLRSSGQDANYFSTAWFGNGFNGGSPWSVGHNVTLLMDSRKPMIAQNLMMRSYCFRVGDCAGIYQYMMVNPGASASSDEGVEAIYSALTVTNNSTGHLTAAAPAHPQSLTYQQDNNIFPGGGLYLSNLSTEASHAEFYITAELTRNGREPDGSASIFHWAQLLRISTRWLSTGAELGSTMPPVSAAFGTFVSCTDNETYASAAKQAATPILRQCVVKLNRDAVPSKGFAAGAGLLCVNAGNIDTGTLQSASPLVDGQQTVVFTSMKRMNMDHNIELWQGGPCGLGVTQLNGSTISEAVKQNQLVMYPIVGSPSAGVIAVGSAFLSGQQGVGYGLDRLKDFVSKPLKATRSAGVVTLDGFSPNNSVALPTKVSETVAPAGAGADASFRMTFSGPAKTSPIQPSDTATNGFAYNRGTYPQAGPDGTAQVIFTTQGWDNIAIAPLAEVLGVGEPDEHNTSALTLNANTLPAMQEKQTLDFGHYWQMGGYGLRNILSDTSGRFAGSNAMFDCYGSGTIGCLQVKSTGMGSTPAKRIQTAPNFGINISGEVNHPLILPASSNGSPAISIRCPGGDLMNRQCDPTLAPPTNPSISIRTKVGENQLVTNSATGSQFYSSAALGGPWLYVMAPGTSNPLTGQPLATDGSQSVFFPHETSAHAFNLFLRGHFVPGLQTVESQNLDSHQPLTVGAVSLQSKGSGIATGELHEGVLRANIAAQLNNITAAAPAPLPASSCDSADAKPACMRAAVSTGNSGNTTRHYALSAVTAYGETSLGGDIRLDHQAAQLSASATNVITCPASYPVASYVAYNLYVIEGDKISLVGSCPLSASVNSPSVVTDDGSAAKRTATALTLNTRNISASVAAAELQLQNGDLCWLAGTGAANDTKAAPCRGRLSESATGQFSFDGTTRGDHQGAATAKQLTLASSAAPAAPAAGTLYYDSAAAHAGACNGSACAPLAYQAEATRFVGSIRTSGAKSDSLAVAGLTRGGHCMQSQTGDGVTRPVSVVLGIAAGNVTLYHQPSDAGATFDVFCTVQ